MPPRHVVVDGSNIATEGRSLPSLVQLDEAVREYRREFPDDVITVVVDATFGHRIDPSERQSFDEAVAHNEIVSPPAGAIGRGDAFLLRVAEKVGATVLSNDSFQEFHGEHEWLFNNGRLIGGKPVPGVGWIFTPRTPVRGPRSRDAVRDARRAATKPRGDAVKKVQKAIAVAIEEAVEPDSPKVKRRRRGRSSAPPAEPVNDPLPFIEFVASHPLGGEVEAEVESFSSHGAFVTADQVRCYIPLSGLGDPPPRAAKEVLKRGETRTFVLQALDPPRRGIELALPGFAHVSGAPTPETVEDEIREAAGGRSRPAGRRGRRPAVADTAGPEAAPVGERPVAVVPTDVVVPLAPAMAGTGPSQPAQPSEEPAGPAAPAKRRPSRPRKAAVHPLEPWDAVPAGPPPQPAAGAAGSDVAQAPPRPAAETETAAAGAGAPQAPPVTAGATEAEAGTPGPRKRPARPRAGAPRLAPAPEPIPLDLSPQPAAGETPPSRRRATAKKTAAQPPPQEALVSPSPPEASPASPDSPPTRRRGAAKKAAAPAVPPEMAAPAEEAAPPAPRKRAAKVSSAKSGAVKKAAEKRTTKSAAAKTAAAKKAAAGTSPAPEGGEVPQEPVKKTTRKRPAARKA